MLPELVELVKSYVFGRQKAYQTDFAGEQGKDVLADLAKFCHAHTSTFHPDPHISRLYDGRREVWLRIEQHLNLNSQELWKIYERKLDHG